MSARRVFRALRTPITLILLIGVLAGGAVWGYHLVVTGVRPVQPSPCVMVAMPELTPESVVIRVYNGGSTRGLANSVAKELRGLGYIVSAVGNTDEIISQTIIVGFSADSPEVQLVASQFLQPGIRVDGRIDHTVDVLIGDDIPRNSAPLASLPLENGTACVAPAAVPTPTPTPTPEAGAEGEGGGTEGEGAGDGQGAPEGEAPAEGGNPEGENPEGGG